MNEIKQYEPLVTFCQTVIKELPCDFVGVAIQNQRGPDVRLHYAVGDGMTNINGLPFVMEKGLLVGLFQREDRLKWLIFQMNILGKALEYPIMLAEKLVSAYAVPVFFEGMPKGVLLVGRRVSKSYPDDWHMIVRQLVRILGSDVKQGYQTIDGGTT